MPVLAPSRLPPLLLPRPASTPQMALRIFDQRRLLAALLRCQRTAGGKSTAVRQRRQRRHHPRNLRQRAAFPAGRTVPAAAWRPSVRACRGCSGASNSDVTGASSTFLPAYITTTRSAVSAIRPQIVGDEHDRSSRTLLHLAHQLQNLRLDRHIQRRRRLVGDLYFGIAGQRHCNHHPLAHAAAELVRIFPRASLRLGDVHQTQHVHRCAPPPAGQRDFDAVGPPPRSVGRSSALD